MNSNDEDAVDDDVVMCEEQAIDLKKLEVILHQFDITIAQANDLVELEHYNFIVLADDSGSMRNSTLTPEEEQNNDVEPRTRFDEVRNASSMIIELASCFTEHGVDMYFCNRRSRQGIRSMDDEQFVKAFNMLPSGVSTLGKRLVEVGDRATKRMGREKPILMFVMTDGLSEEEKFEQGLTTLMAKSEKGGATFKLQLMACTSVNSDVEWLSHMEYKFPGVDCIDDYQEELKQVMRAGKTTTFTKGDWVLKAMLGPVSKAHDALDEHGIFKLGDTLAHGPGCCSRCTIS